MDLNEADVSMSSRYHKYSYWNIVLETEFLETLVREYPSLYGDDTAVEDVDEDDDFLPPLIRADTWSLALISPEDNKYFRSTDARKQRTANVSYINR